jgi:hypothetical protein
MLFTKSLAFAIEQEALEAPKWAVGDRWTVDVKKYSCVQESSSKPKKGSLRPAQMVVDEYSVEIEITGKLFKDWHPCWQITFAAPVLHGQKSIIEKYVTLVDRNTGETVSAVHKESEHDDTISVKKLCNITLIDRTFSPVMPMEILPWNVPKVENIDPRERWFVKISSKREGGNLERELIEFVDYRGFYMEFRKIRQVWRPGDSWWSEFEEHYQDALIIRACLRRK